MTWAQMTSSGGVFPVEADQDSNLCKSSQMTSCKLKSSSRWCHVFQLAALTCYHQGTQQRLTNVCRKQPRRICYQNVNINLQWNEWKRARIYSGFLLQLNLLLSSTLSQKAEVSPSYAGHTAHCLLPVSHISGFLWRHNTELTEHKAKPGLIF